MLKGVFMLNVPVQSSTLCHRARQGISCMQICNAYFMTNMTEFCVINNLYILFMQCSRHCPISVVYSNLVSYIRTMYYIYIYIYIYICIIVCVLVYFPYYYCFSIYTCICRIAFI